VVADVSTGYHHDAINHQMAVIERLGRESKAYMTMLRTDSQLLTKDTIMGQGPRYNGRTVNAKSLDFLDAVFLMPSGAGNLTDQRVTSRTERSSWNSAVRFWFTNGDKRRQWPFRRPRSHAD